MRLLSSIIKGQRIRSESTLEIENTNPYPYVVLDEVDENPAPDIQVQQENINNKMQKAQSKAGRIIQEAKDEALAKAAVILNEGYDTIKRESVMALEKAKNEGYEAGYEKGQLEAQSLKDEGNKIISDAKIQKQQILDGIEPEIIEMVVKICGKLISEEINYNRDTILILIRKALAGISSDSLELSIKVSPDEYDYVLENKELINTGTLPENMQITKDAKLNKGMCIIETPFGSVACNVDEAFLEIKQQMRLIYNKK